jgi:exodeoxyribonuclease-3
MKQLDLFSEPKEKHIYTDRKVNDGKKKSVLVASWNVNSIRSRINLVTEWIKSNEPDILCLQEIKVEDEKFPYFSFQKMGYSCIVYGQKTYNGVAIISKDRAINVKKDSLIDKGKIEARIIRSQVFGIHIITVYVPNAKGLNDVTYDNKIKWLSKLHELINNSYTNNDHLVVCGDFNVAPNSIDTDNPSYSLYQTFIHPAVINQFNKIINWGLTDSFRLVNTESGHYTWWDYRGRSFEQNRGMRIDHILVSNNYRELILRAEIDKNTRATLKPSDHAPILVELSLPKDNI